ncbi:MAG: hypothetical protein JSW10_13235 [Pseudomonadota bacterium]|nr:MAG: hypothetical protein JSW10_13235 [Pseudomonadota bacterium]
MNWLVAVFIIGALVGAILILPGSYSADLSRIGNGTRAVVLVHDTGLAPSIDLMHAVDQLRDEFEGRVQFLVADVRTESGKRFAHDHGVGAVTLVFFDASGKTLSMLHGVQAPPKLRQAFDTALGSTQ